MVPAEDSGQFQSLIDRLRDGEPAARRELLDRACHRLRRLTAKVLHGSFPALRPHHDLDSVVHETWLRLLQALETTTPPTVADFFRLAAHKVRQVLLDMVERQRRLAVQQALSSMGPVNQTQDPARLAMWTEFHSKAAELPEEERAVFEMHYYLDLPQTEIATILGLHPRKVSYLWVAATERLTDAFDGELSP
jgi:RNA polymerase sigma factor (sigma-70 family)